MTEIIMTLDSRKKVRVSINNINDLKDELNREGYIIDESNEDKLKEKLRKVFNVGINVIDMLFKSIRDDEITYRASDIRNLIDYMGKVIVFENEHNKLCNNIRKVKRLVIDRIEYEREPSPQDNVEEAIKIVAEIKENISKVISEKEKLKLESLEKEIDRDYLYAKDIELLKKMLFTNKDGVDEEYNLKTKTKTISLEIPKELSEKYIPVKKGTIEYHHHLSNNIPRVQRLTRNLHKYMKADVEEVGTFRINQSEVLQDSINIAVGVLGGKEFKAVSGSDELENYCRALPTVETVFKCFKVNRLGKLGVGYTRVKDSEKKIFEEIHKQIESRLIKDEGNLILFSKWEPCPSCYYVISQFCKRHPKIKVEVKYSKSYGELE